MQTSYILLLTVLLSIVFFSLGWAVAWRMLLRPAGVLESSYLPFAEMLGADSYIVDLRPWVEQQSAPFTTQRAVTDGLGLDLIADALDLNTRSRVGSALRKLGCMPVEVIDGTAHNLRRVRAWAPPAGAL